MRKIIYMIVLSMTCLCVRWGTAYVSAADNVEMQYASYYNGVAEGVGMWNFAPNRVQYYLSAGDLTPPSVVSDELGFGAESVIAMGQIASGESSWYNQSVLTWQTTVSDILAGEFETIVELYPTQRIYPTTIKFRMANANGKGADFNGLDVLSLGGIEGLEENIGSIMVDGKPTGYYYNEDTSYTFRIVTDPSNDKYSVYLVSGEISDEADGEFAEPEEEILLGSKSNINNDKFSFVRTVEFMLTNLPTDEEVGVVTYFNNIEFNIQPCNAEIKSQAKHGDTEIHLLLNQWVAASGSESSLLAGDILVKKNGVELKEDTDYTVSASSCARSTLKSYSRLPVIKLNTPIVGGDTFEIGFDEITDYYNRSFDGQLLTVPVPAQEGDKLGAVLGGLGEYILDENSGFDNITNNLRLDEDIDGVQVLWTSSDETVIAADGTVTRPNGFTDMNVTLSAELSYEGTTYKRVFDCNVKTTYDPTALENAVNNFNESMILGENSSLSEVTTDLTFLSSIGDNITVSWMTSNGKVITAEGKVIRPSTVKDATVLLTATFQDGIGTYSKHFTCTVKTSYDPNRPPFVTNISVTGIERAGNTLKVSYDFDDVNKLADKSEIQWQYSKNGKDFFDISGANEESYKINSDYIGAYIRVAILPINGNEKSGETTYSEKIGPVMKQSTISGGGSGVSSGAGSGSGGHVSGIVSLSPPSQAGTAGGSNNASGTAVEEYSFLDVPQSHWAADSVNTLVSAEIISRDSNRRFRPDDSITREEFVKMIVMALNIEGGSGSFTDMDSSYWAYEYVAAAQHAGIVDGYDDGTFGGKKPITRQEMAVILKRAKDLRVWKGSIGEAIDFTDKADIADFALESVAQISAAGVISGMPDGSFMPEANATRAEAAKMICEVYANV